MGSIKCRQKKEKNTYKYQEDVHSVINIVYQVFIVTICHFVVFVPHGFLNARVSIAWRRVCILVMRPPVFKACERRSIHYSPQNTTRETARHSPFRWSAMKDMLKRSNPVSERSVGTLASRGSVLSSVFDLSKAASGEGGLRDDSDYGEKSLHSQQRFIPAAD